MTTYAVPDLDISIPVYNEERVLRHSVLRLYRHLATELRDLDARITIVDNASTDGTPDIGAQLARELPLVRLMRLERKGRGFALRSSWSASDADVVAYMAIGSRLAPGSEVTRGAKRELISRSYNLLLRASLGARFSDAQCGFKAGRRAVIADLLPRVLDDNWFFDTELLYLAQSEGVSIHEVAVRWVDDPDSRVRIVATALEDLRGVRRLRAAARADSGGTRPALDAEPAHVG